MKHHGEGQKQVVTTANSPPKKASLLRLREKSIFEYNRRFSLSLTGAARQTISRQKEGFTVDQNTGRQSVEGLSVSLNL